MKYSNYFSGMWCVVLLRGEKTEGTFETSRKHPRRATVE
jgi:hypothetical protein